MNAMLVIVYVLAGEPQVDAMVMGPYPAPECFERAETLNEVPKRPGALRMDELILIEKAICTPYIVKQD